MVTVSERPSWYPRVLPFRNRPGSIGPVVHERLIGNLGTAGTRLVDRVKSSVAESTPAGEGGRVGGGWMGFRRPPLCWGQVFKIVNWIQARRLKIELMERDTWDEREDRWYGIDPTPRIFGARACAVRLENAWRIKALLLRPLLENESQRTVSNFQV